MGIKTLREISEKKRGEDMFEKLERKLVNVLLFFDLFKMKTKIPTDFRGVMRTQDKRVQKLVKELMRFHFIRRDLMRRE